MALVIPEAQKQDGRLVVSTYDANVDAWPGTKNGPYDLYQRTGLGTTTGTISAGPEANNSNDTLIVVWNTVMWFMPVGISITIANALANIINTSGNGYTFA